MHSFHTGRPSAKAAIRAAAILTGALRHVRRQPVACAALFFALAGTGMAATPLITGKQVKNGSLTGKDVKNNSLTGKDVKNLTSGDVNDASLLAKDFKPGQLPAGPQGTPGQRGPAGPSGPFPDELPRSKTIRGLWGYFEGAATANQLSLALYSFIFTLSAAPEPFYVAFGTTPPAECPGTVDDPRAQPGSLCVYERVSSNSSQSVCSLGNCSGATKYGFMISANAGTAGIAFARGTWAVTAP